MVLKIKLDLGKFNKVPIIMGANEHEGLLIKVIFVFGSCVTAQ